MSKRAPEERSDGHEAYLKRQKLSHVPKAATKEDIQSSRQLHQLLAFDQDVTRAKHGIQSLKGFLDGLQDEKAGHKLALLKEYLESQVPKDEDDKTAVYLSDIMQTWSFGAQSNNDSLLSAVPAVLALLLKVMSNKLDLVPYGLRLGRTLLLKEQLHLLDRCLGATKGKDFIISPALRLLREMVTFDGGALAKQVFKARDSTLKGLARNLGLRHSGEGSESRKKPSVRTNALRVFLGLLKFLPADTKKELLKQRDIITGTTRDINRDPPFLVLEFLDSTKSYILKDDGLPRDAKSRFSTFTTLQRLAQLYGYRQEDEEEETLASTIQPRVHEWLLLACTTVNSGVLYKQNGCYPRDVNPDDTGNAVDSDNHIDLGLDSLDWSDKYVDKVSVRNNILSDFIQTLRPWSSNDQSQLLLAILKAAPELVADYFFKKKSFSFEPKLTATWIGYSSFLYSALELPLPKYFGLQDSYGRAPPPTSIVIESILPQPLNQKTLTKCLGQKNSLITFFALRILIVAFQKLEKTLDMYQAAAAEKSSLWADARTRLLSEFYRRCPTMKIAVDAFRTIDDKILLQKHAASKLLLMYYRITPQVALESKFDVSGPLTNVLRLLKEKGGSPQDRMMRILHAENLFRIAHHSPGMRWFNKAEGLQVSPFTAMLALCAEASSDLPLVEIRSIIASLASDNGILQSQTKPTAVDALITALKSSLTSGDADDVFDFVDNCALRCSTKSINYIAALDSLEGVTHMERSDEVEIQHLPISLLLLAIQEQYLFVVKSDEVEKISRISAFIAQYLAASVKINEDKPIIKSLSKTMVADAESHPKAAKFISKWKKLVEDLEINEVQEPETAEAASEVADLEEHKQLALIAELSNTTYPDFSGSSALQRWTSKEVDTLVEEGYLTSLIALLSSPTLSARLEALTAILKISHKLKESTYPEKEPIWLLLQELQETAKPHIRERPIPNTITAFACAAVLILQDPLHNLYPKANHFLTLGPTWELDKLPLVQAIISQPPSLDDGRYAELTWLASYLLSALIAKEDLAIFHKRRVFEKILGLYGNPYVKQELRMKILQVIWRATDIEGGSETLLTRFGVVSWLKSQMAQSERSKLPATVLLERILSTCSKERVKSWSGMKPEDILGMIVVVRK
jgi:nucleolar pre-ribosomal-associated protein 1